MSLQTENFRHVVLPSKIRKRNGEITDFDQDKITRAVYKATIAVNRRNLELAQKVSNRVVRMMMEELGASAEIPTVEQVQDIVEKALIKEEHSRIAKAYILYREKRTRLRAQKMEILNGRTTKIPFTMNALQVVAKRYLKRDEADNVLESPEEMMDRVSGTLANVEKKYGKSEAEVLKIKQQFEEILTNMEFTPGGRTLANAGLDTPIVANCVVLHIDDSMTGIFETLRDASVLQQAGCGLGFPFHLLRPAGSIAKTTHGVASGPVSFLRVYNEAFGVIKQQNRHGANMGILRVDHPDILEFIHSKDTEGQLRNFNISIGLTDEFMQQVKENNPNPWMCTWKGMKMKPHRIHRDVYGIVNQIEEESLTARELFMEVITSAWLTGEPGCVFLDEVNITNPLPGLGRIEACNPCGEQFLSDSDVCNLGSINLERFVTNGEINFRRLTEVSMRATRMLDNVIDMMDFPAERVQRAAQSNRRIGLGIMGFADMLYMLHIPYNSQDGYDIAEKVMQCIQDAAHRMSRELAEEKGVFPNWEKSVYYKKGIKMRNAALTNIAPTGTTSMMLDVSGGVEPYFALAYVKKNILGGKVALYYTNRHLKRELKVRGLYNDHVMEQIVREGTLKNVKEIPEDIKRVFVTSMDISADDHIRMQAAFQRHIDNSISKTINFPNSATKDDVLRGYLLAWELRCKGCTVYRDGSRETQILNLNKDEKEKQQVVSVAEDQTEEQTDETKEEINKQVEAEVLIERSLGTAGQKHALPAGSMSKAQLIKGGTCPECKAKLEISEGCASCKSCGFAVCSV